MIGHVTPSAPAAGTATRRRAGAGLFVLGGILLIALNLRIAVTSLGALLSEVRDGLGLSGWLAGLVTTLPTVAFAVVGPVTPWLVRRVSPDRILAGSMVALAGGQGLRAVTDSPVVFVATTALAMAGIALANVLLPALVKEHFPERVGVVTGAYSVALITGASVGAAAAVPVADVTGSWRAGLGVWAALALLAVLPVLPSALRRQRPAGGGSRAADGEPTPAVTRIRPGRSRLGWAMTAYFGTQALSAYALMGWLAELFRDAGYSPSTAGLLLSAITVIQVPVALSMPTIAVRLPTLRPVVLGLSAASALAYVGLAIAPHAGALAWVTLLAVGQTAFPLALAAIGLRARTREGTVALSAFTQSGGYLLAALGPLMVGLLHDATDGWVVPLAFLFAALVAQTLAGLAIARPRFIEDEPV
jgi:CP family cyanate transporter-like MFS transporter